MAIQKYLERLVLGIVLFVITMASLVKVLPSLFPTELTSHMDVEFAQHSTVCITNLFGYQSDPLIYKTVVGIVELSATLGLLFKDTRPFACFILLIVMTGAIQSLICLQKYADVFLPLFLFLDLCYILVFTTRDANRLILKKKVN